VLLSFFLRRRASPYPLLFQMEVQAFFRPFFLSYSNGWCYDLLPNGAFGFHPLLFFSKQVALFSAPH